MYDIRSQGNGEDRRERLLIGRDMRGMSKVLEFVLSDLGVKVESEVRKAIELKRKKEAREGETEWNPGTKGKWVTALHRMVQAGLVEKVTVDNRLL